MRTLTTDSKGSDVSAWQTFLTAQGFKPGKIDGFFGGNTRLATIAFQSAQNLGADGVVGKNTYLKAATLGFAINPVEEVLGGIGENDIFVDQVAGITVHASPGDEVIYFTSKMTIDADGAYRAYKIGNKGLDFDQNGKTQGGKWVGAITDSNGDPIVQKAGDPAPGYLISSTSLVDPTRARTDPMRYVDSELVPYIVLPGGRLSNAGLGDYAIAVNTTTGKLVHAIVGDSGPKSKIGEASMAVARVLLGENKKFWNPRSGGTEKAIIRYIIFPGSRDGIFPSTHPARPELLEGSLRHINSVATGLFSRLPASYQKHLI